MIISIDLLHWKDFLNIIKTFLKLLRNRYFLKRCNRHYQTQQRKPMADKISPKSSEILFGLPPPEWPFTKVKSQSTLQTSWGQLYRELLNVTLAWLVSLHCQQFYKAVKGPLVIFQVLVFQICDLLLHTSVSLLKGLFQLEGLFCTTEAWLCSCSDFTSAFSMLIITLVPTEKLSSIWLTMMLLSETFVFLSHPRHSLFHSK